MGPQARGRAAKIAGVAGITLLVAACGSSSPSNSTKSKVSAAAHSTRSPVTAPKTASGIVTLTTKHTTIGTVLTNSKGFTLYGFTRDTSTASACTGACARTWHPLTGTPQAAAGMSLPGKLGTITRSGDGRQATFNGHPLYTFKEDTAPGDVKGENEIEFGGRWLAVQVVGAAVPVAPSRSGTLAPPTSSATRSGTLAPPTSSATRSGTLAPPTSSATAAPSRTRSGGGGP